MAKQTIKVEGLGQYGYLPDIRPSSLPLNAFSYSRNWRFSEAGHAEVTSGYQNAFSGRSFSVGQADTKLSFMYTWLQDSTTQASVTFDRINRKTYYLRSSSLTNNTTDYYISKTSPESETLTYTTSTPTNNQFRLSGVTLSIQLSDTEAAKSWASAANANARLDIYGTGGTEQPDIHHFEDLTSAATRSGQVVSITVDSDNFPSLANSTQYQVSVGTDFTHNSDVDHNWSATDAFGLPIFVNPYEAPWILSTTDVVPTLSPLTNWPTGATCQTMTKFNAFLFAIGYENSQGSAGERGSRRTIAISDVITTPGTLPTWDFAATNSFAQIFDLSLYTDGELVGAIEADNVLFVFSTTDTIAMHYDDNGAFSATKLPLGGGTLSIRSVCSIPNGRFHIGNGRMYTEDGSSYTEVGEGRWASAWFDAVDEERVDEIQTIYDSRSHSVWIKTPTAASSQEMWIYNLNNQTIAPLDDHQEIEFMSWSAVGLPSVTLSWNTLDSDLTWDTMEQNSWNDFPIASLGEYRNRLLSCGNRTYFVHDLGFDFNGRTIDAILQREGVPAQHDSYSTYSIQRAIPWVRADAGVQTDVRVGGSVTPDRATNWTSWKTWTTGTTQKLDFRINAKWGGIAFRSNTSDTSLTGYEIDVVPQNRR